MSGIREGYGRPHSALGPLLQGHQPVVVEDALWGTLPLVISTYVGTPELPADLVVSVRCIVTVGEQVLICEEPDGRVMIVPGGRLEPGETWQEAAVREVHEETGWELDVASLRMIGFLHLRGLVELPETHPYPHPDFLQIVVTGTASGSPEGWVDDEGAITRSWLADRVVVEGLIGPGEAALLARV